MAVLSGDVIGSTRLSSALRRSLPDRLREVRGELEEMLPGVAPYELDMYSGDAWQLLLLDPSLALRSALLIRARLRSAKEPLDTRVSIGIGAAEWISQARVSESQGPAFVASGRRLSESGRGGLWFTAAQPLDENGAAGWDAACALIDVLVGRWTRLQSRAVWGALQDWKQDRIGRLWRPRIRQEAVAQHLAGAGWDAVKTSIRRFEHAYKL